jgi:DNA/RNA-binding domain of Phe-tRNA-synthetase-like protein
MITVSENWKISFPSAYFGALVMEGIDNSIGNPGIEDKKARLEEELRKRHIGMSRKDFLEDESVALYERHFRKFGQGYPVLHQLETVALKGKPILSPSSLVAAMFMVELKNGFLTAGHDFEKVFPPMVLDVAGGSETYQSMGGKDRKLQKGDMFLSDRNGILSSVLYGPDNRSHITLETSRALFTVYGAPSLGAHELHRHLEEIEELVFILSPGAARMELGVYP